MNRSVSLLAATVIIVAPATSFAKPVSQQSTPTTTSSPFGHTGQPGQSCEDDPFTPGESTNAPGSAFNPDGVSGSVYAGEQPGINDKNDHSVSQYDTACTRNQSPSGG
jgi:hypothetical protein